MSNNENIEKAVLDYAIRNSLKARSPEDKNYNKDYEGNTEYKSLTLHELIEVLTNMEKVHGPNMVMMMSYDSGAGYEEIDSVYSMEFHNDLIGIISCLTEGEALESGKPFCLYPPKSRKFND